MDNFVLVAMVVVIFLQVFEFHQSSSRPRQCCHPIYLPLEHLQTTQVFYAYFHYLHPVTSLQAFFGHAIGLILAVMEGMPQQLVIASLYCEIEVCQIKHLNATNFALHYFLDVHFVVAF